MATFLTRLIDKGLLTANKRKRPNVYTATVTELQYNQLEAQNLLNSMYDGSLQKFLSVLYGSGEIDANKFEEQ
jgi:predicted transcriptional regulator